MTENYKDNYDDEKSRLRCISAKYIHKNGFVDDHTIEEDMEFLAKYAMDTTARLNKTIVVLADLMRKHPKVVKD